MKPKILILTGLLIIALALIAMVFRGPQDTATTVDTTDWVTYRNEELGFELKHPEGWQITEMKIWDDEVSRTIFAPSELSKELHWWFVDKYSLKADEYSFEKFKNRVSKRYNFFSQKSEVSIDMMDDNRYDGDSFSVLLKNNSATDGIIVYKVLYIHKGDFVWSFPVDRVNSEDDIETGLTIQAYQKLIDTIELY